MIKLIATNKKNKKMPFKMISDLIHKREFPITLEIDYTRYDEVDILIREFMSNNQSVNYWQVKLDNRKIKTYKDSDEKIYVIDCCENIKSIENVSLPVFSMANKNEVNPILIIDRNIFNNIAVKELRKNLDKKGCLAVCGESKRKY